MSFIDKYLNTYFFLGLNLIIIVTAETFGGGTLFYEFGIIHIIAVMFIFLAFIRVLYHRYTHDPILQKFINMTLVAMAVFAIAHIAEFITLFFLGGYSDGVFANASNLYLISLLLIVMGAESFLRVYHARSAWLIWVTRVAIIALLGFTVALIMNGELISLEPEDPAPYIYTIAMIAIASLALKKALEIKKQVSFTAGFINYLAASILLICLAIIPNTLYDFFVHIFHLSERQTTYFSHFAFYGALSVLFLAFGQIKQLGGVLDEVDTTRTTRTRPHN